MSKCNHIYNWVNQQNTVMCTRCMRSFKMAHINRRITNLQKQLVKATQVIKKPRIHTEQCGCKSCVGM
jgi:hypothetical protein